MSKMKIFAFAAAAMLCVSLTSCGAPPAKDIKSIDDLANCTIGVQLGTTGDTYISGDIEKGVIPGAKISQFKTGFEAVQSLKQGKIDAVVIDDQPAKVFIEKNKDLVVLDTPYTIEDYAICMVKENTELKEQFNKAIQELKDDGTLQSLLDFYIGKVDGAKTYESPEGITYDGKLVMATNAAFEPYEYHATDDKGNDYITGLDADLAKAICDKLGKELEIQDMDFDSIVASVQTGKADFGAAGLTVTEDRLANVDFTDSYCTGVQVIIVRK